MTVADRHTSLARLARVLTATLRRLERRRTRQSLMSLLASVGALALVLVIADHAAPVGVPRPVLSALFVAGVLLILLAAWAALRARRRYAVLHAAHVVERAVGERYNAVINAASLWRSHGESGLTAAVALQAGRCLPAGAGRLPLPRSPGAAWRLTAAVAAWVVYLGLAPKSVPDSLARLFGADLPPPSRVQIRLLRPADGEIVHAGDALTFEFACAGGRIDAAELSVSPADAPPGLAPRRFALTPVSRGQGASRWGVVLAPSEVMRDLCFECRAGDGRLSGRVRVYPRPTVAAWDILLTPPAPRGEPPARSPTPDLVAWPETEALIAFAANTAVADPVLVIQEPSEYRVRMTVAPDVPNRAQAAVQLLRPGRYRVEFSDSTGRACDLQPWHSISIRDDGSPPAQATDPAASGDAKRHPQAGADSSRGATDAGAGEDSATTPNHGDSAGEAAAGAARGDRSDSSRTRAGESSLAQADRHPRDGAADSADDEFVERHGQALQRIAEAMKSGGERPPPKPDGGDASESDQTAPGMKGAGGSGRSTNTSAGADRASPGAAREAESGAARSAAESGGRPPSTSSRDGDGSKPDGRPNAAGDERGSEQAGDADNRNDARDPGASSTAPDRGERGDTSEDDADAGDEAGRPDTGDQPPGGEAQPHGDQPGGEQASRQGDAPPANESGAAGDRESGAANQRPGASAAAQPGGASESGAAGQEGRSPEGGASGTTGGDSPGESGDVGPDQRSSADGSRSASARSGRSGRSASPSAAAGEPAERDSAAGSSRSGGTAAGATAELPTTPPGPRVAGSIDTGGRQELRDTLALLKRIGDVPEELSERLDWSESQRAEFHRDLQRLIGAGRDAGAGGEAPVRHEIEPRPVPEDVTTGAGVPHAAASVVPRSASDAVRPVAPPADQRVAPELRRLLDGYYRSMAERRPRPPA